MSDRGDRELRLIFEGAIEHPELDQARAAVREVIDAIKAGQAAPAITVVARLSSANARNVAAILACSLVGALTELADLGEELDDATAPERAVQDALDQGLAIPRHVAERYKR